MEVRHFCRDHLAAGIRRKVLFNLELDKSDYVVWQKILHERGWAVGHWPREYGGCAWTAVDRYIFDEETALAGAPWLTPFGIAYAGPVIYTFGSEAQKARYLPGIRATDTWWCQGYSEPGAGSDLANLVGSLRVRRGAHRRRAAFASGQFAAVHHR